MFLILSHALKSAASFSFRWIDLRAYPSRVSSFSNKFRYSDAGPVGAYNKRNREALVRIIDERSLSVRAHKAVDYAAMDRFHRCKSCNVLAYAA